MCTWHCTLRDFLIVNYTVALVRIDIFDIWIQTRYNGSWKRHLTISHNQQNTTNREQSRFWIPGCRYPNAVEHLTDKALRYLMLDDVNVGLSLFRDWISQLRCGFPSEQNTTAVRFHFVSLKIKSDNQIISDYQTSSQVWSIRSQVWSIRLEKSDIFWSADLILETSVLRSVFRSLKIGIQVRDLHRLLV